MSARENGGPVMSTEEIRLSTEAFDNAQNAYLANPSPRNREIYREAKEQRATLILDAFDDGVLTFAMLAERAKAEGQP